jgi:hypothetical protein
MPLIAAYALSRAKPRPPRRLFSRLGPLVEKLREEHRHTAIYRSRWGE